MTKITKTKSEIREEFISKQIDFTIKPITLKVCKVPYETFLGTPESINRNIQKLIPIEVGTNVSFEVVQETNEEGVIVFYLVSKRLETTDEHSDRILNEKAKAVKKLDNELKLIVSKFTSGKKLSSKEKELLTIAL